MAVDPATQNLLDQMSELGAPPLHTHSPAEARAMGAATTAMIGPGPDVRSAVEHELVSTDGGSFRIRVLVPEGPVRSAILYLHGGGWVVGDIDGFDTLGRQLANRTASAVVLVDYRKAPEAPYPAAVEDAWTALEWVNAHLDEIAGAAVPIVIAGDSAGGNLATVAVRRSRDRSGPAISLQVLIYPVTDADLSSPSYLDPENQLLLDRQTMTWFWDHYAPEQRRSEPDASPLRAESLAGLPPAAVLIAEHDVLRGEGEAYAHALEAAGVPVTLRLFEGQMHGFFSMVNILPGSATALDHVVAEIGAHLDDLEGVR
jgi:acetyl esterase